jgi:hypothetical protein
MNDDVVRAVKSLREDWEDAAEGHDLTQVHGSVGLILNDLCDKAHLTANEKSVALGGKLFLDSIVAANLPELEKPKC